MLPGAELDMVMDTVPSIGQVSRTYLWSTISMALGSTRAAEIIDELTNDGVLKWDAATGESILVSTAKCDLCGWDALAERCSHHYYYTYRAPWQVHYFDYDIKPEDDRLASSSPELRAATDANPESDI